MPRAPLYTTHLTFRIHYVRWTEVRAMAIKLGPASPMYKAVFGNTTVNPVAEEKEGEEIKVPAVYSNDENSADYLWNAWFYGSTKQVMRC